MHHNNLVVCIKNNTKILNIGNIITGDSSTGIFSSNNAEVINTGDINFGNSGIGIYGVNTYGSNVSSSYNKINITLILPQLLHYCF